ncbi:MAG: hypothetical protein Q9N67_00650 [Ghiorsea sp.]|nr:hypothetical protein [Ghiorsea sp.]
MKNILGIIFVVGMAWLAWNAWFPPQIIGKQQDARAWIPERPHLDALENEKWRVFTKRMVWKKAVEDLQAKFQENNMNPIILEHKEAVQLHVFDDPRTFVSNKEAQAAKKEWHIESVDILRRSDGKYMLGLGRFYLPAYAQLRQEALQSLKKPYKYFQDTKIIPTYRFIFPALPEKEAEVLWKTIQDMGAINPVMMTENEFNAMFMGGM